MDLTTSASSLTLRFDDNIVADGREVELCSAFVAAGDFCRNVGLCLMLGDSSESVGGTNYFTVGRRNLDSTQHPVI